MFADLGTNKKFSTAYHTQIDGQAERVNQVLEDMLHMYVMEKPTKWEYYLHLVEFAYNNGWHASLGNHARLRGGSVAERLRSMWAYGWVECCNDVVGCGTSSL